MTTFRANGEDLEIPNVTSLTMDESIVVYNYSGLTLDQLEELQGLHPGLLAGLVHVAVQRANPDLKPKEIEQEVRALNLAKLIESIHEDAADEPEEDLLTKNGPRSEESDSSSGDGSSESSVLSLAERRQPPTGTPESAISESGPAQESTA